MHFKDRQSRCRRRNLYFFLAAILPFEDIGFLQDTEDLQAEPEDEALDL